MQLTERLAVTIDGHRFDAFLENARAPRNAGLLRQLAVEVGTVRGRHAVHTGPELSCPLAADELPFVVDVTDFPLENSTHLPAGGDIVLVCAGVGQWGTFPANPLIDIGFFYEGGGRLAFPFGEIEGSVAARFGTESADRLRAVGRALRETPGQDVDIRMDLYA